MNRPDPMELRKFYSRKFCCRLAGFYFAPNVLRCFRVSFCGKRRPEEIHQKSPPVFNAKFPGKYSGRKKAHKHKLSALVNVQIALRQTAGCHRVKRAKKFMCSPRNTGHINVSLRLTGGLSQVCFGAPSPLEALHWIFCFFSRFSM